MVQNYMSSRRREALRLDLEDQQKALVDDVHQLTRGLVNAISVSEHERQRILTEVDSLTARLPSQARQLQLKVDRLHRVTGALCRVSRSDFGLCDRCGEPIPFQLLAEDPARTACGERCASAVGDRP